MGRRLDGMVVYCWHCIGVKGILGVVGLDLRNEYTDFMTPNELDLRAVTILTVHSLRCEEYYQVAYQILILIVHISYYHVSIT